MAIDPDFLTMLRCPDTQERLLPADQAILAALNARIRSGQVRNRGGAQVTSELTAGLVTAGGAFVYPIQQDIPILLSTEAIPIANQAERPQSAPLK